MNPELINNSEIARLRQQIDLEVEACRRMFRDPAIVASHAAINRRMEQIGSYIPRLHILSDFVASFSLHRKHWDMHQRMHSCGRG